MYLVRFSAMAKTRELLRDGKYPECIALVRAARCVCVCVRACVRVCVCLMCVCLCAWMSVCVHVRMSV